MPRLGIVVAVEEAYTQCSKALIRSDLWNPERHIDRSELPSSGEILRSLERPRRSTPSSTTASAPSATPAAKGSTSRASEPQHAAKQVAQRPPRLAPQRCSRFASWLVQARWREERVPYFGFQ